jgi:hypothetical protein
MKNVCALRLPAVSAIATGREVWPPPPTRFLYRPFSGSPPAHFSRQESKKRTLAISQPVHGSVFGDSSFVEHTSNRSGNSPLSSHIMANDFWEKRALLHRSGWNEAGRVQSSLQN